MLFDPMLRNEYGAVDYHSVAKYIRDIVFDALKLPVGTSVYAHVTLLKDHKAMVVVGLRDFKVSTTITVKESDLHLASQIDIIASKIIGRLREKLYEKDKWNFVLEYCKNDVAVTEAVYYKPENKIHLAPSVTKVIFNDPATIVFFSDGDKVVVKTMPGDIFDPEKGLAMAISKKFLGKSYHRLFKENVERYKETKNEMLSFLAKVSDAMVGLQKALGNLKNLEAPEEMKNQHPSPEDLLNERKEKTDGTT